MKIINFIHQYFFCLLKQFAKHKKKRKQKHVKRDLHLHTVNNENKKKQLGSDTYNQEVISSLPVGLGICKNG